MRNISRVLSLITVVALFASCRSTDFEKTATGLPYQIFRTNPIGKEVKEGYFMKVHVNQTLNDSLLFDSRKNKMPIYIQAMKSGEPYDITEIFYELRQGDSVHSIQMVDSFIVRNPGSVPPHFKRGDKLHLRLKVLDVFETPEQYMADEAKEKEAILIAEIKEMQEYLIKKKITAAKTGAGVFVEILEQGSGPAIDSGKTVSVMYKGSTLAGVVFDSNLDNTFGHTDPLTFTVGTGQMIKGFDDGVKLLKQGSKARIYIPSMLAYAGQPPSDKIKPFEALIFEVEIK